MHHFKRLFYSLSFILCLLAAQCPNNTRDSNSSSNIDIKEIVSNNGSTFAISEDGKVYAWGLNTFGQLGLSTTDNPQKTPKQVTGEIEHIAIKAIKTSNGSTFVLSQDGKLYAWGNNAFGQLGFDTKSEPQNTPRQVIDEIKSIAIKAIATSNNSTFALSTEGKVYAWGYNEHGELGYGTKGESQNTPKQVTDGIEKTEIIEISTDGNSTFAISKGGKVYAWGNNEDNILGLGNDINSDEVITPQQVLFEQ